MVLVAEQSTGVIRDGLRGVHHGIHALLNDHVSSGRVGGGLRRFASVDQTSSELLMCSMVVLMEFETER